MFKLIFYREKCSACAHLRHLRCACVFLTVEYQWSIDVFVKIHVRF